MSVFVLDFILSYSACRLRKHPPKKTLFRRFEVILQGTVNPSCQTQVYPNHGILK